MNTYEYQALEAGGAPVSGRASASDELALDRELEGRGLVLTRATVVTAAVRARRMGLQRDDLIALTTQLATVTSAGVHIVEGLEGIGKRMRRPQGRALVGDLVQQLRAGSMLSDAMERHPRAFPDVYRASVRAGEASGALDRVLVRLAKYLEWIRGIRATSLQALIYPAILFVALFGLVLVLLYFVLPRIIGLFPGGRDQLPAETRAVLAVSDFLTGHWMALLTLAALAVAGFVLARRTPIGRERIDAALLRLPALGDVARRLSISRFASTASVLQEAGCDVFTMLNVSGSTSGNAAVAAAFSRASEAVRRGSTITQAFEREPLIDPLLVQMVSVGEKTGELDQCLNKLVAYYDEEIPRTVKKFLTLLEPAMLLFAGFIVALILLAALMPIFTLYETLG